MWFLGRQGLLVASGGLLQRMVAAFSTFSLVVVVLGVQHERAAWDRVELPPWLESLSQSSVSVMVGLVPASDCFVVIENVLGGA